MNQDLLSKIEFLEYEIKALKDRNIKVDSDKAWEKSLTRRLVIAALTYFITSAVFYSLGVSSPFLNALIPLCGYLLSTLSIRWVKNIWDNSTDKN